MFVCGRGSCLRGPKQGVKQGEAVPIASSRVPEPKICYEAVKGCFGKKKKKVQMVPTVISAVCCYCIGFTDVSISLLSAWLSSSFGVWLRCVRTLCGSVLHL